MSSKSKAWLFKLKKVDSSLECWETQPEDLFKGFNYLIYFSKEDSESSEYREGYVYFNIRKKLSTLKHLDPSIYWTRRSGTHKQTRDYFMKESNLFKEIGDWETIPNKSGCRSHLNVSSSSSVIDYLESPNEFVHYLEVMEEAKEVYKKESQKRKERVENVKPIKKKKDFIFLMRELLINKDLLTV